MQHDLNMLEVGPVFDSTVHTAQLLTLLFFAMTFAPGLPLLMPLCCFTFIMYFNIDKYLLCRFYQKPPQLGDAAIKIVINYLPWAAVIRLAIACWMFGNENIIPVFESSAGQADSVSQLRDQGGAGSVGAYLFRENTLPLFVLMMIVVAGKLLALFFEHVPVFWICKFFFIVVREMTRSNRYKHLKKQDSVDHFTVHPWELVKTGDLNRQQVAPFTGEYMRFVKHKDEIPDTCLDMCSYAYLTKMDEAELEDGWEVRNSGDYVIKLKVWTNVKKRSKHKRGDIKKTYEVVADHRCATYNIEKIPKYMIPMQGLREGTMSMMENQIRAQQDKNVVDAMIYETFDAGNMESNVIANYNKRKTLKPGETMPVAHTKALLSAALYEEDDEDGEDEEESPPKTADKTKPVPMQGKGGNSRGVAIEDSAADSFHLPPPAAGPSRSPHGRNTPLTATPNSITAITAAKSKTPYGAPPSALPAYLVPGADEHEQAVEEHKPYFPKSRSQGASSDQGDYSDPSGHKPYFPPARSGKDYSGEESSGKKKKKDKKNKIKKEGSNHSGHSGHSRAGSQEYELTPVSRPSPKPAIQPTHSYEYEEDESDFIEAPHGGDFDDGGGVGGLV